MNNKIEVKREKLPTRCEICHQEDFFDALSKKCGRCDEIEKAFQQTLETNNKPLLETQTLYSTKIIGSGMLLGFIIGQLVFCALFVTCPEQDFYGIVLPYRNVIRIGIPIISSISAYCLNKFMLKNNLIIEKSLLIRRIFNLSFAAFWGLQLGFWFNSFNDLPSMYKYPIPSILGCLLGVLLGIVINFLFVKKFSVK